MQTLSVSHNTSTVPTVLVMMATYNGSKYLREQIDSVLAQNDVDVTLRICDDQSPDNTYEICQEYAANDSRVIATRNEKNLGVGWNFMQMVYDDESLGYDYYAFCDQDDIWLPDKLSRAIERICEEAADEPALYYSDVVDFDENAEWNELESFIPCEEHSMTILFANWASGCTMVFNSAFFTLFRSYKPETLPRIHDAWAHLVARYCATVVPDFNYSGIRRRITGNNAVGVLKDHHKSVFGALQDASNLLYKPERAMTVAAADLVLGFGQYIKPGRLDELERFLSYHDSLPARIHAAVTFDYYRPTLRGKILMMTRILLGRI